MKNKFTMKESISNYKTSIWEWQRNSTKQPSQNSIQRKRRQLHSAETEGQHSLKLFLLPLLPQHFTKCISITLPWFFSFSKFFVAGKNISISSGTFLITWTAHSAAYKKDKRFISIKPGQPILYATTTKQNPYQWIHLLEK